ncbi:class I SAM-dependent methyltransferase [Roseateles saccharophilus]|uniref:SAM-dependent MidA family methyltransferase n=1 Tax=Roseateles saccharophilus TaxID=304 RepID=A0A4R3VAZ6_ROSSA|nr:SAM-dependent methyltransferase [Roseateles saccharophilus]MDG0831768.1 class I SAM-dependent methyltransferase [Roseateles saccharophilus]TCV01211.1 SAM-dependent MidA family methyltransferase [Roseateles saccharophilus]
MNLVDKLHAEIAAAGGWLPFDRFMATALYAPGLGYYAGGRRKFGQMPGEGSDFVTAPEMSPLFGRALARQLAQAMDASGCREVMEFGAGSGALAVHLIAELDALGAGLTRYRIVELSAELRERQRERLVHWRDRVEWLDELPDEIEAVVVGNEVLDAMPVQLIAFDGQAWRERGVVSAGEGFAFEDRDSMLRPPLQDPGYGGFVPGTVTEIHPQAEAFVRTLARRLKCGAAFFIDYGFPEAEYYHPQRHGGTLMCHQGHMADPDPLHAVGDKDITAHVNFTGIALAGQDAGLVVLGYTSQANFLLNCGIADLLAGATLGERAMAHRLLAEHEMGELFKVIGFAPLNAPFDALGFERGDRSHKL